MTGISTQWKTQWLLLELLEKVGSNNELLFEQNLQKLNLYLIGFHNYHHTFPWDYATSEFGPKYNLTTCFIDMCAAIGWAYDRKTVTPSVIRQRKLRTGSVTEKGAFGLHWEREVFGSTIYIELNIYQI